MKQKQSIHLRRTFQELIVFVYLLIMLSGLLYTLFRVSLPFVPDQLTWWSYGTMGPYQGYLINNGKLVALGQTSNGEWVDFDVDRYTPYIPGERDVRNFLVSFRANKDKTLYQTKYQQMAQRLLELEAAKGTHWQQIKLYWYNWPKSTAGYQTLMTEPYIHSYHLATAP